MRAEPNLAERVVRGALCGALATLPMTITMVTIHRCLPRRNQYPLPPQLIVEDAARAADQPGLVAHPHKQPVVWTAHYGYGALMGAIYGAATSVTSTGHPTGRGVTFGLGVWGVSYVGGLPILGSRASAPDEPLDRNLMMVASHVVWGAVLGRLFSR